MERSLFAAALLLPPPYREAVIARDLEGRPFEDVLRFLILWWEVGRERARQILQLGRPMLAETVAGADPRARWSQRFTRRPNVDKSRRPYPKGVWRVMEGDGALHEAPQPPMEAPWPGSVGVEGSADAGPRGAGPGTPTAHRANQPA